MQIFSIIMLVSGVVFANIDGVDVQLFNPTTNAIDFVTVQSSKVLPPSIFNVGMYFNGSFNSLSKRMDHVSDFLLSSDVNLGFGLVKDLDAGLSLPAALYHAREDEFEGYYLESSGLNEIRFNSKYNVFNSPFGFAIIGLVNIPLSNGNPYTGDSKMPIYNLELAFDDFFSGKYQAAFNIGYRFRKQNSGENAIMGEDQIIYSFGLSYYSESNYKYIMEFVGATGSKKPFEKKDESPLEVRGTLRKDLKNDISILGGIGVGLSKGLAAPLFRLFLGINLNFGMEEIAVVVKRKSTIKHYVFQLNFLYNKTKVYLEYKTIFNDLLKTIRKSVVRKIIIIGHTDSLGTDEYNKRLSIDRARVIRDYLVKQGINRKKIRIVGKGESQPIADNSNFMGRKINRRVEIKLIGSFEE